MSRTGFANLPLHPGKAPPWLFQRMVKLSRGVSEAIIDEYGTSELLRRVSDPYWFQAFSCVIGFDWHSSGTTTTSCGALKEALSPELGVVVAGGKGKTSRKAPEQIEKAADNFSINQKKTDSLVRASRMSAKVDNNCIQDNFQLYHHCFFLTEKGEWAVVQQGMSQRFARRYHWLSDSVERFVVEPHEAICCDAQRESVLDMTTKNVEDARRLSVDLGKDGEVQKHFGAQTRLNMPNHHIINGNDLSSSCVKALEKIREVQPKDYEELVSLQGVGAATLRALAMVANIVYGSSLSWKDPVKFSFAHGGKDGTPFPVNRERYDNSIRFLREAVENGRIEKKEQVGALKRLSEFVQ